MSKDIVEDIVNTAHQDDMKKILVEFDKFLRVQKQKNVCAILPEMTIAKYCLAIYNKFAKDKAIISFVPKEGDEWTGRVVKTIRPLTKLELDAEGWEHNTSVIEFTDGTVVYPSRDDEGNGAGSLFGKDKQGECFSVYAKEA